VSPITLFALVALLACAWPALRLSANPAFRQVAPGQWSAMAALGLLAGGGAVGLAVLEPDWLLIVTVGVVLLVGASAWRSRPGFGSRRGLPPGSLSPWESIEALVDRDFYTRRASRHGPIFKMSQFHRGVICVVGLERGHRLLREHRERLGPSVLPFNREVDGGFLRYMDDSTHRKYAPLFRACLSPAVVGASESMSRTVARQELENMAAASALGRSRGRDHAVACEPYLRRLVSKSFLSVLFGVQPGSESAARFERIYPPFGEHPLGSSLGEDALEALAGLRRWVMLEAESQRIHAERQVSPSALGELIRLNERMPDQTSVDNLLFIHKISSDNVVALLRWLLKILGDHPEWVDRLRAELGTESKLSDRVVLEVLRLAQSEYLYREVVEEIVFDGFTMPRKWLVRLCVRESHADPEVYCDPDAFDPDRFLNQRFDNHRYSPFGFSPHACNGVDLTMMIARSWVESLCGDFDWSIARDGPVERGFRHWNHWRPSRSLAISLRPRFDSESRPDLEEARA
jgi:cytochrome P450